MPKKDVIINKLTRTWMVQRSNVIIRNWTNDLWLFETEFLYEGRARLFLANLFTWYSLGCSFEHFFRIFILISERLFRLTSTSSRLNLDGAALLPKVYCVALPKQNTMVSWLTSLFVTLWSDVRSKRYVHIGFDNKFVHERNSFSVSSW